MRRYQMLMLALIILVLLILPPAQVQAQDQHILIYVNGIKIPVTPVTREGILYLPPMPLSEALGAKIEWVPRLNIIKVNDEVVNAVPLNIDGRIYIPVESIAHAVGANVEWDGTKKTVRIYQGSSSAAAVKPVQTQIVSTPAVQPVPVRPVPANNQTAPGSYSSSGTDFAVIRPTSSPPTLSGGLKTGPPPVQNEYPELAPPKTVSNNVFKVTVTGTEVVQAIKDYYKPKHGSKFIVIYLSQQNVSNEVQIYTGKFSLLDQKGRVFDYIEGLSNFWLMILRPSGINFGYLIYEVPEDSQPAQLVLQALNQKPLTLNL